MIMTTVMMAMIMVIMTSFKIFRRKNKFNLYIIQKHNNPPVYCISNAVLELQVTGTACNISFFGLTTCKKGDNTFKVIHLSDFQSFHPLECQLQKYLKKWTCSHKVHMGTSVDESNAK